MVGTFFRELHLLGGGSAFDHILTAKKKGSDIDPGARGNERAPQSALVGWQHPVPVLVSIFVTFPRNSKQMAQGGVLCRDSGAG